jgi:hypothetical protein
MSLIWTEASLEPKRKFRYLVTFSGAELKDFQFLAQTCDRPGIKIGSSEHKYFDKSFFHPGRVSWDPNPLSIKLVDIQKSPGAEGSKTDTNISLLKTFMKAGLSGLIGQTTGAVQTVGKKAAVSSLGTVKITVFNSDVDKLPFGTGENALATPGISPSSADAIAEQWELKNAWLESFKPDALDYGAEDILTVTMTVRYDWAQLKGALNGFGSTTESNR